MTLPETISADYTLRPAELAATLKVLVEARQPVMVWGPPGCAKSEIAQQVAAEGGRTYCDVRALLLDPVDLRGIPWRDQDNRTRWAAPDFLPPSTSTALYLVNLEELPSGVPMVQAALFQLVRDRKCGEYELPEGASLMACGNRQADRGVVHRMPTPLASRFVHLEIKVDAPDWCAWAAGSGIAPEVLFYIQMRPDMLHQFDPQSREAAVRLSQDVGVRLQHRQPAGQPRRGCRARIVPGRGGRGRGGRVHGVPEGVARAARTPRPSSTIPRTPTSRTTRAR